MIRICIADDHDIVRGGLKRLCGDMGDLVVAAEARNGDEVLALLGGDNFDLLLLDLAMPGLSGIKLIERIREREPSLPILVLSMHSELQIAKRALQAGASGFVAKGSTEDVLLSAIRKVAAGQRFIDSSVVEQMMFERPAPATGEPHERLSARELQIMKLFAMGKSINEIAEELFISHKTVSTHKTRLMQKMNIATNAELVRYVADHGLIV